MSNNLLWEQGLNLQAIFDLQDLPKDVVAALDDAVPDLSRFRQLILIGHGGRKLWESLKAAHINSDDPIDTFSVNSVKQYFENHLQHCRYQILYPGISPIPLQRLGELAGWHHPSPLRIGINQKWGTWFAYRVLMLADSRFEKTERMVSPSPCEACPDKLCIANCPASALGENDLELGKCIAYRMKTGSDCYENCLARLSCPEGEEHRYSDEQISYHYSRSMMTILNIQSMKRS